MSKNNNNAGMRLKRYFQYGDMDDLTYYDNHSTQGIINKRNDILAEYNIFLYDKYHEEEIKQVSSVRKLCDSANKSDEIKVRVHDKQKVEAKGILAELGYINKNNQRKASGILLTSAVSG